MINEQLEAAFQQAQLEWLNANPGYSYNTNQQRYFFFAGSTFGCKATSEIYDRTVGKVPDEVDGVPV